MGGVDWGEKMKEWSFLYFLRVDLAFFDSHLAIHKSSLVEYPFYQIRYIHADGVSQWHKIFLILCSS